MHHAVVLKELAMADGGLCIRGEECVACGQTVQCFSCYPAGDG